MNGIKIFILFVLMFTLAFIIPGCQKSNSTTIITETTTSTELPVTTTAPVSGGLNITPITKLGETGELTFNVTYHSGHITK